MVRRYGGAAGCFKGHAVQLVRRAASRSVGLEVLCAKAEHWFGCQISLKTEGMEEEHVKRRLAAVLAADAVGFSRLLADDEVGTLSKLKYFRDHTFDPAVSGFGGRIVKLMGDGTLVEFASIVDAVNCAVAIQQANTSDKKPEIVLRIGINLGDVIIDGDDIYGDGVNIAARLEPLVRAGGVCISSIVKESIGERTNAAFIDGDEVQVKNIERPLTTWQWHPGNHDQSLDPSTSAPGLAKPVTPITVSSGHAPSIAVLPFENMSGDDEQEYFSDGISEDIITDLSKINGLQVNARNSSFIYKGKRVDLRTVGRELNVETILEGSVRRAGDRAITLDPDYADAFALLGIMNILDFHNHWSGEDAEAVFSKAEGLANRALALDPEGVLSNHAIAVAARWRGHHDLAASAVSKALLKSPDYALGLFTRGEVLMALTRLSESISDLGRAIRLDPSFTHQYLQFLGMSHFLMQNYETAAFMFRERLLLVEDTDIGRAWLASTLGHTGDDEQAKTVWEELLTINPDFSFETRGRDWHLPTRLISTRSGRVWRKPACGTRRFDNS